MRKPRKHYTAEQKRELLLRHLIDKVPVSEWCEEHGLQPTVFYRWQKKLFENGEAAFEHDGIVSGHHRVLLPGDIEALQESRLVESFGDELRADVLLAPHHGSSTSSSQLFIDRVRPSDVVFTVSRKNRWDFPDEAVISRYRAIDARLHRSDHDGAIRFYSKAGTLRVTSLRRPPQRSWRRW